MKLKFGRKGLAGVFLAFMFAWGIFPCFSNAGVLDTVVASTYLGGSQSDECYSIAYDSEGNVFVAGKTASLADLGTGIQNVYETYKGQQDDVFVAKFDASLKNLLAVTYLGGSGWEGAHDLFVDASDKVFVTGYTTSSDFPVTAGAYDTNFGGVKDAFVAKFSNDLSVLEASTFLGGAGEDISYSIVIDSFFDVFIAGSTRSADFPAAGGYSGGADGFLAKLTNDLSVLTAATYMGGTGDDYARAVSLDAGNILVAGNTRSAAFTPAISGANMGSDDIFAARFDTNLNCQGGTYAGGSLNDFASDIAADSAGNIFITGRTASFDFPVPGGWDISHNLGGYDAFALKLNSNFVLQSGTYLGGTGYDFASALAVDGADNVLIAGSTGSTNFPPESIHSGGGYDAFALMLSNDLGTLTSSSILGGSGQDDEFAITLGAGGTIYVAGRTASTDFPALNAWDLDYNGGDFDAFVARFGMNLVSIPDMTGGGIVEIPVNVFVATGIAGFEFKITYDPNVLNAVGVLKGTLLGDNWNIIGNTDVAGQVIVAGHSNDAEGLGPVTDGSLVKLVFAVVGAGGSTTNLTFIEGLLLNPFVKVLETGYDNGLFTVEAGGGTLKVTIAPQEAIDAGAQWSIDGANWFDSGFTLYLAPGGYTVQYTNMENWYVPTNQDVTMTSGGAEERTGTYSRHQGTLDVVIEPEAARNAGVLWSIDGGVTGYPSGGQQVNTGTYTLTYSDLAGWDKPADVPGVVVLEGQTTGPLTGTYVQHLGSLTVTIAPQGAIDAGAQWSIDGGTAWNDSGATMTGIQVGTYTVTYKQVGNWNEPAGEDVVINRDQETTEDGTYVRQTGTLTVTIEPQGARDAGAQWSMDEGTTWNNSGVTTGALETGPFAVTFSGIQGGFGTPADILVNLQQGPNNVTGRYTWTWTVDPSGGGDFTTIQAAIDGSAPGDTILVVPGTYNEFLNINKDNLIIRSTGGASVTTVNVLTRTAQQGGVIGGVVFYNNGITLDGFTIQDMTVQSGEIKVIRIEGNQNTLTNCVVRGNIYYTATNKTDYGILVYGSDNTISGNEIYDIGYTGINVVAGPWSDAEGNTISNNILHDIGTADAFSYGITIDRSGNNKLNIVANQFYNLLGGDAKSWAMVVWGQMAEGTNISGHNITNVPNGISLASACGVLVANNTIQVSNVGMRLFYSSWAGPVVDNNVIVSNTITGGTTGFLINPNGGTGVIGANNLFAYNNIYGNTTGAENLGTVAFDARNNWWGDATGPYHATNNPQGLGNPVSDYIIFDPMLGAPVSGGGILDFDNPSYENGDAGLGVDISFAGGEEGTAVVTLLGANPTDNELFDGSFFDVFLSDPGDISEVKIKLYYNEPSAKVAYWFNGTTWVECSDQQVVAGAVTVGGEDYDGYVEVTINSSTDPSLADLTATYFALRDSELYKGRLTVAITPQGAVVAGAQWSIDGTNWYDSGDYLNFLDTGTYTVSFKGGVAGYMPPADIQVDVVDGETDSLTGHYATIITVGLDGWQNYNTIQAAINAATPGDTIIVYPGTYA
ncbi:MAG TPA: SBBP repeat-containing protein, partial [bacterium]|nr:SBBP repeat-containing protein [bacterium]